MFQIRLIACSLLMAFMLAPLHAQRTGSSSGGGGTGRASDSVLGTWEATGAQSANRLDLLVLWRGRPGWFANAKGMAVGGSEHLPVIPLSTQTRGLSREVRLTSAVGLLTECVLKPEWIRSVGRAHVEPYIVSLPERRRSVQRC